MSQVKGIKLDTRVLDRIAKELRPQAKNRIDKSAFRVEAKAKQTTLVYTGANMNSGYTNTGKKSNYTASSQAAQALNPDAKIDTMVQVPNDMSAVVGFPMEYSLWLEIKQKGGKPYLVPAMESEEKMLIEDLKKMIK